MADTRTLILLRHGAAGHAPRDEHRPLTAGGRADAAAVGAWVRASLPTVEAVLCSTATRTRQTLEALAIDAPVTFADELYGAGVDDILEVIERLPDTAATALVVGHAPGIPSTAYELATVAALARDAGPAEGVEALRHFSACAVAVLTTTAPWNQLAEHGADLVTVRHPDH